MASGQHAPPPEQVQSTLAKVKTLLNRQLAYVLREEGIKNTGVKAIMQSRLTTHIEALVRSGQIDSFNRVRSLVQNPDPTLSPGIPRYGTTVPASPTVSKPLYNGAGMAGGVPPPLPPPVAPGLTNAPVLFKDSPFYTIVENLTPFGRCPAMQSHRNNVTTTLKLRRDIVDKLKADPALRIMVYCAADDYLGHFTKSDIAFPQQVELKVNQDDVKANLKGVKGKQGSTLPADITAFVRKLEHYTNTISMSYALTQKSYTYVVRFVRMHTVAELVERLRKGKTFTKESVIRDMVSKAQDADIVATSTVMSLRCPVSGLRIGLPSRSMICTHNQCFDAPSFLEMQTQGPTWACPICHKAISFEGLVIDQYVKDILESTSKDTDQVTIEPDGRWSQTVNKTNSLGHTSNGYSRGKVNDYEDEDADVLEIQASTPPQWSGTATARKSLPIMSRPPEYTPDRPAPRSTSSKRTSEQIIDLTLSDDEDSRPTKRPSTNGAMHSFSLPPARTFGTPETNPPQLNVSL